MYRVSPLDCQVLRGRVWKGAIIAVTTTGRYELELNPESMAGRVIWRKLRIFTELCLHHKMGITLATWGPLSGQIRGINTTEATP